MKCKKCGYKTTTINGMRKHYMKAHPAAMKHHGPRRQSKGKPEVTIEDIRMLRRTLEEIREYYGRD